MHLHQPVKILILSTPVAPIGSGVGGGVELTICNLAEILQKRGYQIEIAAPKGSRLEGTIVTQIPGELQPKAQNLTRDDVLESPAHSVLSNMCSYAKEKEHAFQLILSFAYDWLPVYLTPTFDTPIAHFISMSSMRDTLDDEIKRVSKLYSNRFACYTQTQAVTFPVPEAFTILSSGIDMEKYQFCDSPQEQLAWAGRISPEKGLDDAFTIAKSAGIPLNIYGKLEQEGYWEELLRKYPEAPVNYEGFFSTNEFQAKLGKSRALLMTPKWKEAFGIVAIEALACGVPVISYNRGGPSEIIRNGVNGFLTKPDSIDGMIQAVEQIGNIDRTICRKDAEDRFSLEDWGDKFEEWIQKLIR